MNGQKKLNNERANEMLQKLFNDVENIHYSINEIIHKQNKFDKVDVQVFYEYLTNLKTLKIQSEKLMYCIFWVTYNYFNLANFLEEERLTFNEKVFIFTILSQIKEKYDEDVLNSIEDLAEETAFSVSISLCMSLYNEIENLMKKCQEVIMVLTEFC